MKTSALVVVAGLIMLISLPFRADAVSWSPIQEQREEKADRGVMEKSEIVCLFQSGTADVKNEIHVNDILPVYRENQDHHLGAVGRIRILSYVGDDYLKGEVVEGEVKAGDVARKGKIASLVISSSEKCAMHR